MIISMIGIKCLTILVKSIGILNLMILMNTEKLKIKISHFLFNIWKTKLINKNNKKY